MKKITFLLLIFVGVLQAQIVNIPDTNFKAKLLSANTTNQIAMNSQFEYFKIDANNDGEIQLSEASEVYLLNINNSFLPNPNTILTLSGIESFVNLKELNASLNSISTFNYNLPLLEKLYFTANNLTTIDLTGTPQLIELNLDQNDLSSLDVSVCENLVSLGCDYNFLSSLDISMLSSLNYLSVRYNQLTSLDLSQSEALMSLQLAGNYFLPVLNNLVNLESLNCQDMGLSVLDFSSNVNLSTLVLNENIFTEIILPPLANLTTFLCSEMPSLTSVNVNMAPSLSFFQCINNPLLQSIFMKNGVQSFQSLNWAENFNLQYVCVDDFNVSNIITYLNSIQLTNVNVNSFCSFTPGGDYDTITGNVRLDNNNNGCDATDFSIPFFKLAVDLNAMTTNSSVFSNNNGVYNLYTATEGVYTLTPVLENPTYFSVSPQPGTAIINEIDNSSTTLDFCVTANGVHPDLEVVIAPVTPARPGFVAEYLIVYKNKGNQVLSQQYGVNFVYNQNLMQFLSASTLPSAQGTGGLQWDYADLMPFESRSIIVFMQINPPTDPENPVNIGDELVFTSVILPQAGDEMVQDNTFIFNQTVVGSYDPNDITCLQGDVVPPSEIGNYLHYLIRFENTGTAQAENVVVSLNINPAQYDAQSLQLLNTSHDASVRMNGQNLDVIFQNIQLETGGHGNILLKMKTKQTLQVGDMVAKKADIYFDYNFPIVTNEAETLFQALSVINPVLENLISIYPNPVKDVVNITIKDNSTIKTIELYDIQGRLLQTQLVKDVTSEINLAERANGMYFIKINTDKGSKVEKLIKE